jgi:nucleotide-binding universal stress UspA family protein
MLTTRPTVVVGVDGSSAGKDALRVGLREASLRSCAVEVVTCWQPAVGYEAGLGEPPDDVLRLAQQAQEDAVTQALAETDARPVVSRRVIQGPAGPTLVRLSRGAEFLVVGTHHKGIMERSVLGSVSEHCVRHAHCPVIVVPAVEHALTAATPEQP